MNKKRINLSLNLLMVVALLLSLCASLAPTIAHAAPPINETFMNSTAPGWNLIGNAMLTSGGVDPVGQGWLRLTEAVGNQAGSAIYNTAFSSTDGVQATFQYATYGGIGSPNGADGISFYLIDGATGAPTVGAVGGSLGYSWNTVDIPNEPGVTNGYVGIGLDEWGNFSEVGYGDCNPPCPGRKSNSVTIRGSGNLNSGFNYLTHAGVSPTIATGNRAGAKWVRITIPPGSPLLITVEIDSGSGFQTVISNFDLTAAPGQAALPATFKMGFSASTGGSTNYHEIRNLTVGGAQPSSTSLTSAPNPSVVGQEVLLTATVTGAGDTPTGSVTFYDGSTPLGTGTLDGSGVATLNTSALAAGMHTLRAVYGGDSEYSSSEGTTSHEVILQYDTTTTVSSSLNPSQYSQAVTFTADVTSVGGTPDGTVTFQNGGVDIPGCVDVTLVSGQATCDPGLLSVGTHPITANYSGSGGFLASSGTLPGGQVVTKADTTTALASSVNPSMYGQMVTFVATVSTVAPGAGTPVGSVTFYHGATVLDTITLDGTGQAAFTTAYPLAVGTHNIKAVYGGSANFNGSTSPVLPQRVEWATDLVIEKSVQISHLTDITFTIVARNLACCCVSAPGAIVSDTLPANVVDATWTCTASDGAECGAAKGTGSIDDTLAAFPPGGVVTYIVRGTLTDWGYVKNTAEVIVPVGVTDIDMSNNSATVSTYRILLMPIFKNYQP